VFCRHYCAKVVARRHNWGHFCSAQPNFAAQRTCNFAAQDNMELQEHATHKYGTYPQLLD